MTEKEEKKEVFELVEVPTQYQLAIRTPKGEILTTEQAIVEILNELKELKKELTGK